MTNELKHEIKRLNATGEDYYARAALARCIVAARHSAKAAAAAGAISDVLRKIEHANDKD